MENKQQPQYKPSFSILAYMGSKKTCGVAYLLWFFIGSVGAHRFYLDRFWSAMTQLGITVLSLLFLETTKGLTGLGLASIFIWLFIDMFLIPGMVKSKNIMLAMKYEIDPEKIGML